MSYFSKETKKGLSFTWSESDVESEWEITNKMMTFTGKYDSCSDTINEEISVEELAEIYRELLTEWERSCLRE